MHSDKRHTDMHIYYIVYCETMGKIKERDHDLSMYDLPVRRTSQERFFLVNGIDSTISTS